MKGSQGPIVVRILSGTALLWPPLWRFRRADSLCENRPSCYTKSEFTELAKSRFLDCESCGMTQGALIRNVADCQALYMQTKQPRSDILYMTTLDTGRCSHSTCSLVVLIALYLTIPMAASRSTDSS